MTPSALLGSASTPPATSSTGGNPRAAGSGGREFDTLLQDSPPPRTSPGRKDGTASGTAASGSGKTPAPAKDTGSPASAEDRAADAPAEDGTAASPGETSTATDPLDPPTGSDAAAAPWPPAGLAGLMLSAQPPTAAGVAEPLLPSPTTAGATPAASAAPSAALPPGLAPGAVAPLALPAQAGATPAPDADTAVEAFQAAIAGALDLAAGAGEDGAEPAATAPTALPLHALQAGSELRGASALAVAFAGEPTPTPSLHGDDFDQAIGARIGWLADQKIGHAHIRISPDDMGTVEVRLQLDGDKVHASFSSPHVDVRQALESSLPRLRELLGEQGFQLAHADVGQQGHGARDGSGNAAGGLADGRGDGEPTHEAVISAAQLIRQRGLLDTYA